MKIIKYQKKGRMWKLKANYFKYVSNFFGKHVYMPAVNGQEILENMQAVFLSSYFLT